MVAFGADVGLTGTHISLMLVCGLTHPALRRVIDKMMAEKRRLVFIYSNRNGRCLPPIKCMWTWYTDCPPSGPVLVISR